YTDEEYKGHIGWGHSPLSSTVGLALDANVKRVLLFHHDPSHDDDMIDRMVEQARELVRKSGKAMVIEGAREGAEVQMSASEANDEARMTNDERMTKHQRARAAGAPGGGDTAR